MGFLLPAITAENLDTQRDVVMNERRQRVDNQPYGRGERAPLRAALSRRPPLPLAGDRLHGGHRRRHARGGAGLLPHLLRAEQRGAHPGGRLRAGRPPCGASRTGSARSRAGPPVPPVVAPAAALGGERRAVLADDVRLPRVYFGFRVAAPTATRLWYAADLFAAVLAGGKSSPLYRDLVYERQIAQDVGAYVGPSEAAATFTVIVHRPAGGRTSRRWRRRSPSTSSAAAPRRPPAADLERARNRVLTEFYSALQKLDNRADLLLPVRHLSSTTPAGSPARPSATSRSPARTSWTTPRPSWRPVSGCGSRWCRGAPRRAPRQALMRAPISRSWWPPGASAEAVDRSAPPPPGAIRPFRFPAFRATAWRTASTSLRRPPARGAAGRARAGGPRRRPVRSARQGRPRDPDRLAARRGDRGAQRAGDRAPRRAARRLPHDRRRLGRRLPRDRPAVAPPRRRPRAAGRGDERADLPARRDRAPAPAAPGRDPAPRPRPVVAGRRAAGPGDLPGHRLRPLAARHPRQRRAARPRRDRGLLRPPLHPRRQRP